MRRSGCLGTWQQTRHIEIKKQARQKNLLCKSQCPVQELFRIYSQSVPVTRFQYAAIVIYSKLGNLLIIIIIINSYSRQEFFDEFQVAPERKIDREIFVGCPMIKLGLSGSYKRHAWANRREGEEASIP